MKYIAFLTKGLKELARKEIQEKILDAKFVNISDKKIIFETEKSIAELNKLRLVDDLCFFMFQDDLKDLSAEKMILKRIDKNKWKSFLQQMEREFTSEEVSTTVSVYKSEYNSNQLGKRIGQKLSKKIGWTFTPRKRKNCDIRIDIERKNLLVGIRVFEKSLYKRKYKKYQKKGTLRPTIAAGLVHLLNGRRGEKVVDNFCGSGTVLAEALVKNYAIYGGDIDSESVEFTKKNLNNLKKGKYKIKQQDATKSTWPENFFDHAVSNLPWGKQVEASLTTVYEKAILEYKRILKPKATICLLGKKPNFIVSRIKGVFGYEDIQVIKIGYLGQNPSIVVAH